MIQGILSFQFILNQKKTGEIEPEFKPIKLVFKKFEEKKFSEANFSNLIVENDIFAIFYQHTTGTNIGVGAYSNIHSGRLKETPYQLVSHLRRETDGSQFLTISLFELDDEIEIFMDLIKILGTKLDVIYATLIRARNIKQLALQEKVMTQIENELKFTIFQVERLSQLDKIQKSALIFNSPERLLILKTLRDFPVSKRVIKNKLEKIKANPNVDILIEPFLELNLIRRDWITGERDKRTGVVRNQGEFLFLTKDIVLARVPNDKLLTILKEKEKKSLLYSRFHEKTLRFFKKYDLNKDAEEDSIKIAPLLLNPDIYDFIALMRENYYPLEKIPKILSSWANVEEILEELKSANIITEVEDSDHRNWLMLLTDIKPLLIFPEYILPNIKVSFETGIITQEIAKKALNLLEVTYPEKIEF